jgi:hypothetical protein
MGHSRNAAALAAQPGFSAALGLALEQRADPWEVDYDSAQAVLAVHTLLHVLGHMLCSPCVNGSGGTSGGSSGQLVSLEGPDTNLVDGYTRVMVTTEGAGKNGAGKTALGGTTTATGGDSCSSTQTAGRGAATSGGAAEHKEAVYISLAAAAKSLGVALPAALPCAQKNGSPVMSPIQAAELR